MSWTNWESNKSLETGGDFLLLEEEAEEEEEEGFIFTKLNNLAPTHSSSCFSNNLRTLKE